MRTLGIGALAGAAVALLTSSPLFMGVMGLAVLYKLCAAILFTLWNGPDMPDARVYQNLSVAAIVQGPHRGPIARKGEMITVALHNASWYLHTKPDDGNQDAPLVLACTVTGAISRNGVLAGRYGRVVAMKMDWRLGRDGVATWPIIRPGRTETVDFSTKLDWDYQPIAPDEQISDCVVGADKYQALLQKNVSVSDQNRAGHWMLLTVTQEGRAMGLQPGSIEPDALHRQAANPYGADIAVN